jgi:plastocyanin
MAGMPASPAEAGGGCHSDQDQSVQPVAGTEVRMERMCFSPAVVRVDPGATVRFSNEDSVVHVALGTGWGTGETIAPGGTFGHRFPQSGIYAYSCNLHPGMNGAVMVGGGDAAPAELASVSSPSSDGPGAARFLALGGLGGALFGSVVSSGWVRRRRHG